MPVRNLLNVALPFLDERKIFKYSGMINYLLHLIRISESENNPGVITSTNLHFMGPSAGIPLLEISMSPWRVVRVVRTSSSSVSANAIFSPEGFLVSSFNLSKSLTKLLLWF